MRIVVLDDYQRVAERHADWASLDADVEFVHELITDSDELVMRLAGAEVVVAMRERTPFTAERLSRLSALRLLVTTGRVNPSIDMVAARELGITVCGTGGSTNATPELAWGLILSVLRHIPAEDASIRSGGWQTTIGGDLEGKRLGVVGLGRLGSRVAKVGLAFGMDVVAWSQNLTADRAAEVGVSQVAKDELFACSDVVSIHYKLSERSRGLVGAADLALMKPTAVLVNTSRSGLIDMVALVDALRTGRLGGAGLDVYDEEPLAADDPLRSCPRTVLTPHLGYVTSGTYEIFFAQALENIAAWRAGAPIRQLNQAS